MTRGRPVVGKVHEIRVPDDEWADVLRLAKSDGVTAAEWVRRAIGEYAQRRGSLQALRTDA